MTGSEWQLLALERDLQDTLRGAALRNGWAFYHTHDSRRSDPGFPDCVCVKGGRMVIFELKAQEGTVSAKQRGWLAALNEVPHIVAAVVRPKPKEGEMSFDEAIALLGGYV